MNLDDESDNDSDLFDRLQEVIRQRDALLAALKTLCSALEEYRTDSEPDVFVIFQLMESIEACNKAIADAEGNA